MSWLDPDALYFLPLGGSGEIGMNFNLYGCNDQWIIVDCGVSFGEDILPGLDVVMPDPSFIEQQKDKLLGMVLTHAHEDHFGAVAHLWPRLQCPVYATPFTAELLRGKLDEARLYDVPLHELPMGGELSLGPFEMQLITLTHSIAEPSGLAIRTPFGTVMHTGDWKIDPDPLIGDATDEAALTALGEEGVLACICDSTNVFTPGRSGSEAKVREHLVDLIGRQTGRVAVTAFASNIARVKTIAEAAYANDRHPVLAGRSLRRNVSAAQKCGHLPTKLHFLDESEAGYLPSEKCLIICTGSQGEPRGALARIANDDHPRITLEEGDVVIFSSKIIPGNERALAKMHNALAELGVEVITERDEFVHVSGHPCRDELAQMYQWIKPQIAVPVHGEHRHLREHAKLAASLQVPEQIVPYNGSLIRLAPGSAEIVDDVPNGRLVIDGGTLRLPDDEVIRGRKRAMYDGHVAVHVVLNEAGTLLGTPAISILGLPEDLKERMQDAAKKAVKGLKKTARLDEDVLQHNVQIAIRRICKVMENKRPAVSVTLTCLAG